jgi:hypothetical protein
MMPDMSLAVELLMEKSEKELKAILAQSTARRQSDIGEEVSRRCQIPRQDAECVVGNAVCFVRRERWLQVHLLQDRKLTEEDAQWLLDYFTDEEVEMLMRAFFKRLKDELAK